MQDDEIKHYILESLGKSRSRDEILIGICENSDLTWQEADAIVVSIMLQNEAAINRRQFTLFFIIAFIFFITGIFLAGYGIYGISLFFTPQGGMPNDLTTYFMPVIEMGLDPFQAFLAAVPAYFTLLSYFLFSPISATFFGIAMIIGSLLGMRKNWSAILGR